MLRSINKNQNLSKICWLCHRKYSDNYGILPQSAQVVIAGNFLLPEKES
jgi:hypothetical protein